MALLHGLLAEHIERPADVVVGIETDRGLLVSALLATGYQVYAINPLAASRYRERHVTSRAKSDRGDAKVLADLVRTDRHNHRPIEPDSPLLGRQGPGALAIPWGSETRIRSRGGAVVLVDQPTEQIPSANVARTDQHRVRRFGSWRGEAEGAMGSPAVVVLDIGPERPIEMPPTEDDSPVEALGPDRLDHALGVGIGVRCLAGRHDHPGPFRANDLVERPAELRVPVANEEPDGARPSVEVQRQVPGLLR